MTESSRVPLSFQMDIFICIFNLYDTSFSFWDICIFLFIFSFVSVTCQERRQHISHLYSHMGSIFPRYFTLLPNAGRKGSGIWPTDLDICILTYSSSQKMSRKMSVVQWKQLLLLLKDSTGCKEMNSRALRLCEGKQWTCELSRHKRHLLWCVGGRTGCVCLHSISGVRSGGVVLQRWWWWWDWSWRQVHIWAETICRGNFASPRGLWVIELRRFREGTTYCEPRWKRFIDCRHLPPPQLLNTFALCQYSNIVLLHFHSSLIL